MSKRNRQANVLTDVDDIQDHFVAFLSEWKTRLPALRSWVLNIHVTTDKMPKHAAYGAQTGAYTEAWSKYENATINLHLPDKVHVEVEELEEIAVHELMHILLSPWNESWQMAMGKRLTEEMKDVLLITEEQACTRLACGYMRTKYPKHEEEVKT